MKTCSEFFPLGQPVGCDQKWDGYYSIHRVYSLLYIVLRMCLLLLDVVSFVLIMSMYIAVEKHRQDGWILGQRSTTNRTWRLWANLFVFVVSLPGVNHGALRGFGIGFAGVNDPQESKSGSRTPIFVSVKSKQVNLFIVKHNLPPVNTTIILIIIVLVLIHN